MIIDEINRGNIASILGELITLLEADKRGGEDESLEAIVPYSKSQFSVPPNLYIIGTMNTADRSVEALDTALRRRFTFVEVGPDADLVASKVNGRFNGRLDLGVLLTTINNRIEKLLNADHAIGHSYFLALESSARPLEDLKDIFANKVIPLLREYFYGDYEKIGMVLGEGFIQEKEKGAGGARVKFGKGFSGTSFDFEDKKVYRFTDPKEWDYETFRSVYEV